jgi:hypothetical protein
MPVIVHAPLTNTKKKYRWAVFGSIVGPPNIPIWIRSRGETERNNFRVPCAGVGPLRLAGPPRPKATGRRLLRARPVAVGGD